MIFYAILSFFCSAELNFYRGGSLMKAMPSFFRIYFDLHHGYFNAILKVLAVLDRWYIRVRAREREVSSTLDDPLYSICLYYLLNLLNPLQSFRLIQFIQSARHWSIRSKFPLFPATTSSMKICSRRPEYFQSCRYLEI